jgi:hypothetical protein
MSPMQRKGADLALWTKVKQTPCNIGLSEIAVFTAGGPTGRR